MFGVEENGEKWTLIAQRGLFSTRSCVLIDPLMLPLRSNKQSTVHVKQTLPRTPLLFATSSSKHCLPSYLCQCFPPHLPLPFSHQRPTFSFFFFYVSFSKAPVSSQPTKQGNTAADLKMPQGTAV